MIKPGMYQINTRTTQTRAPQLPQTSRNTNPYVSTSTGVIHITNVSRPQLRSTKMKDMVMPNNSQVRFKKTELEDHHKISYISNKTKSVNACNDRIKSRTSNVNAVYATCGKCVFNLNHDACVSKFIYDMNARTKKPKVVPIITRKPKSQANKSVETPPKKTVASRSTIQKSKSYYRMLYDKTSKEWKRWIAQQCPSGYKWVHKIKMKWVPKVRKEDVNTNISPTIDNASRITKVLKITNTLRSNLSNVPSYTWTLFLRSKYETPEVLKDFLKMIQCSLQAQVISVRSDRGLDRDQRDCLDGLLLINTSGLVLSTTKGVRFYVPTMFRAPYYKMFLPFSRYNSSSHIELESAIGSPLYDEFFTTGTSSVNKSSSPTDNSKKQDTPPTTNIQSSTEPTTPTNVNAEENNDNQAVDTQVQQDKFINPFCTPTKDHTLEQVCGNPSKPLQTRRQLATDPKMCMFALTVSTAEPKNIKEAMVDSSWIEAMK
ncbi:hypothetical protein Tco_1418021 [Tanacetum coccineum]